MEERGQERHLRFAYRLLKGVDARVKCIYPDFSETPVEFSKATGNVSVKFDRPYMARLFEIEW